MIETNPSSNAATVSIYLSKSFIVSNIRDSLVYIFGGLSVRMYVIHCCVTLCVKLIHLFLFSRKLNGTRFLYLVLPPE